MACAILWWVVVRSMYASQRRVGGEKAFEVTTHIRFSWLFPPLHIRFAAHRGLFTGPHNTSAISLRNGKGYADTTSRLSRDSTGCVRDTWCEAPMVTPSDAVSFTLPQEGGTAAYS